MANKTERLHLRLTPELKAELQALADAQNRSMSNLVESLLLRAVENDKKCDVVSSD